MALTYRPSGQQLLAAPLGAQAQVGVLGVAANGGVQAAFVEAPAWLQPTNSPAGHITISFARGAQAAEGGVLVRDAMLAAAGAAAAPADIDTSIGGGSGGGGGGRGGNNNSSSSSSYQPWDEELPLLGRVGVRVSLPAATAAQLRASGRLALGPQPQQHQQQRQQQQGEEEVVLYSIEDVAACGCLSLDAAALAHFYTRHAAVLGQQVRWRWCLLCVLQGGAVEDARVGSRPACGISPSDQHPLAPLCCATCLRAAAASASRRQAAGRQHRCCGSRRHFGTAAVACATIISSGSVTRRAHTSVDRDGGWCRHRLADGDIVAPEWRRRAAAAAQQYALTRGDSGCSSGGSIGWRHAHRGHNPPQPHAGGWRWRQQQERLQQPFPRCRWWPQRRAAAAAAAAGGGQPRAQQLRRRRGLC
jgi:hypothetical protein